MNQATSSQSSQPNQQSQEQNYFTTATETQLTDTQQMTSAASPGQMSQNGYAASINSTNVQSTQFFTQQQSIGGTQTAQGTARGSNTLTYTATIPPETRAINQPYCKISD